LWQENARRKFKGYAKRKEKFAQLFRIAISQASDPQLSESRIQVDPLTLFFF
jgi:hypothetical protein